MPQQEPPLSKDYQLIHALAQSFLCIETPTWCRYVMFMLNDDVVHGVCAVPTFSASAGYSVQRTRVWRAYSGWAHLDFLQIDVHFQLQTNN